MNPGDRRGRDWGGGWLGWWDALTPLGRILFAGAFLVYAVVLAWIFLT